MTIVIVMLHFAPFFLKMTFFTLIQFLSLSYSTIVRPFESCKDNIIEIMNDLIFFVFSMTLTICDEIYPEWVESSLVIVLSINSMLISVVQIIDFLFQLFQRLRKCLKKRKNRYKTEPKKSTL